MRKAILPAFLLLALALPAGAAAQNVPPGNSAAAQYTETFPTAKGEKDAQGPKTHANPNKVIGSEKTKKLEEQGPEGAAVAEFTAETAPTTSTGDEGSSAGNGNGGGDKSGGGKGDKGAGGKSGGKGQANGSGQGKSGGQGEGGGEETSEAGGAATGGGASGSGGNPSGTSAVGEVASQATGVSSGALGLWLPIVLIGVLAWAGFMFWRRREGPERAV